MLNLSKVNLTSIQKIPLSVRANIINNIPAILRPTLKVVPFSLQKAALLPALQSVFKEAIEDGDFEFLQDKWLKITITDLNLHWWLSYDRDKLIMAKPSDVNNEIIKEDVSFSASGDDLILIAGRKQDPDTLFFQRRLKIEGDTELGLEVKNLIDAIDLEQLPSTIHTIVDTCATLLQQTQDELKTQTV